MYLTLFFILFVFSLFEVFHLKLKGLFHFLSIILLLMVLLKFGQGQDYFSYIHNINWFSDIFEDSLKNKDPILLTREFSFTFLSYLWISKLHLSAELFFSLIGGLAFYFNYKFILKYSTYPILSLFIYYCTFYLIYPFSVIRQGICASVFLLYLIPLMHKRKWGKYLIFVLFLMTIHYSAIILLFIPLYIKYRIETGKKIIILSILSIVSGFIFNQFVFSFLSNFVLLGGKVSAYANYVEMSHIISIFIRILTSYFVIKTINYYEPSSIKKIFVDVYVFGFLIYLFFLTNSLVNLRLTVYMRFIEIILLSDYLYVHREKAYQYLFKGITIVLIMCLLYFKNIIGFIDQGNYKDNISIINYPYVSVFNKEEIINYRGDIIPLYYNYIYD